MITIEESIPFKSDNYRYAEDIFFLQFNDISFYIEDTDQENFYYAILCKLFPNIRIEKIFPLDGKENVVNECKNNIGDKTKIYLVDKDFDDLLNKKQEIPNLFYLNRYSIENYLIENESIVEYIVSERPRLKRRVVNENFNLGEAIETIKASLSELIHIFILVQSKCRKLKNVSLSYERFFDFDNGNFRLREAGLEQYIEEVKAELKEVDQRMKFDVQLKKIKKQHILDTHENCIIHFPGKFVIKMIKQIIESTFGLNSRNVESFSYRIACNSKFNSLNFLKDDINSFLN